MPEANEWLYREIVENARDAVVYSDREGLIYLWNTGAEHIFGYSRSEALGQSLDLIIPSPSESAIGKATTESWRRAGVATHPSFSPFPR